MKILKRSLLLLLASWLLLFVNAISWDNSPGEVLTDWPYYILPFIVVLAGLLLGWFGVMIIQYSKWIRSFYLFGLNASGITLIVLLLWTHVEHWKKEIYATIHPSARFTFEESESGLKGRLLAMGFDTMCRQFANPWRVHLMATEDSIRIAPAPLTDTSWTVYYSYKLDPDTATIRFSKVDAGSNHIHLLASNQLPDSDSTYRLLVRESIERRRRYIAEILAAFKDKPDTTHEDSVLRQGLEKLAADTAP